LLKAQGSGEFYPGSEPTNGSSFKKFINKMNKVSFGLVDPYLNEAIVWRDKPNSKLQARYWRQQDLRKQDYNGDNLS